MANPPCPNPEIYDAGNCCGGACFEQETPEIIAAANAGTLYPPAPQAAPEAGKAVKRPLRLCGYCRSWQTKPCGTDCVWQPTDPTFEEVEAAALASSPAPTGAEPVAWRRCNADEPGQWFDVTLDAETAHVWRTIRTNQIVEPLYAAPQAVPAEDVAGLIRDLHSHADEQIEDNLAYIQRADTLMREAAAALTASEAEATDLRRKLEEHRRVLAEARERINRYADTAAEHDLVARIDALAAPLPEDTHHGR